jgi:hypothetical protein
MRGKMHEWRQKRAKVWGRDLRNGYDGAGRHLASRRGALARIRKLGPAGVAAHMAMMNECRRLHRESKGLPYHAPLPKVIQVPTKASAIPRESSCEAVRPIAGAYCWGCGWTYGKDKRPHKLMALPPGGIAWGRIGNL